MHDKDAVTEFYKRQAKHDRQLNRLLKKPVSKWKDKDFEAVQATRAARDSAVAALSTEQAEKHAKWAARLLKREEAAKVKASEEVEAVLVVMGRDAA